MDLSNLELFREKLQVIMVTSNYWVGLEYQRHHLTRNFINNGVPVVFIERTPQRWPKIGISDLSQWWRGKGTGNISHAQTIPEELQILTPKLFPPSRYLRTINRLVINREIKKIEYQKRILITYVPTYNTLDLIDKLDPILTAYVCVHNYEADNVMNDLLVAEKEIINRSDALFADSKYLIRRLQHLSNNHMVYESLPGSNYNLFKQAFRGDESKKPKKIYYFGGIGPHLDLDLYIDIARAGFEVTLIGPVDPIVRKTIPDNIKIIQPVSNKDLPALLKEADLLLIAYKKNDYIDAVIPAKLFECLSTGKPLIVSGIREADYYKEVLYDVSGSIINMMDVIQNLEFTETKERLLARANIAQNSDWKIRFEHFVHRLNESYLKKYND
jgi:hypothetical protein